MIEDVWNWLFVDQPDWVGNVSNLTSFTIFGAILGVMAGFYRRYSCKYPGCRRLGLHRVKGTTYHTCEKHLTTDCHATLQAQHAKEHPEQHELLNAE